VEPKECVQKIVAIGGGCFGNLIFVLSKFALDYFNIGKSSDVFKAEDFFAASIAGTAIGWFLQRKFEIVSVE
jgi:hypothetical protein